MEIHLLVVHRKESFPGQLRPEVLAVCDEVTFEEYPEWWDREVAKRRSTVGDDANAWAEVTLEVDTDTLMAALYPPKVPAVVTAAQRLPAPADAAAIGVGSWVREAGADGDEADDYGYVVRVVDGGYAVIWHGDMTAKFAGATDVVAVETLPQAVLTRTRQ